MGEQVLGVRAAAAPCASFGRVALLTFPSAGSGFVVLKVTVLFPTAPATKLAGTIVGFAEKSLAVKVTAPGIEVATSMSAPAPVCVLN